MSLVVKDLVLGYEEKVIVKGVNVTIPTGKMTMLIGGNGCGKSTLLHGMSRLLAPKSGEVCLDGQAINEYKAKDFAKKLAILPQAPVAPEGITVRELCYFGRNPYRSFLGGKTAKDHEVVEWALEVTGVKMFADRLIDALSGGQRQRVWIAMVLAQETDILLLDEPTTYLDLAYQLEILELLKVLNEKHHKTIIMVHHELNQAARYAQHLICMKEGHIHSEGTPEEVFNEIMIREVFGVKTMMMIDPVSQKPMCIPV